MLEVAKLCRIVMNGLSAHGWSGRGWKGKEWLSVVVGVVSRRKEVEVKKSFRVGVEAIEAVGGFEDTLSTAISPGGISSAQDQWDGWTATNSLLVVVV
jgi:hypothetical protein